MKRKMSAKTRANMSRAAKKRWAKKKESVNLMKHVKDHLNLNYKATTGRAIQMLIPQFVKDFLKNTNA